jgi:hypothetical protein
MAMARSKFGAVKVTIDDIEFDSKSEGQYYKKLKLDKEEGKIKDFDIQPTYLIHDAYEINNKKVRPIHYKADFIVYHLDGRTEVIDIKGMDPTPEFKLKKKLFESKFNIELICIKYVVKFGGWITLEEYKKRKRLEKKGL